MKTIVTFSNLFPSSVMPVHGVFVRERMRRVARASGLDWVVVAPVPEVIWPLRRGIYKDWSRVPAREDYEGVTVHHPRYRHWPGLSMRGQADAVARGAREIMVELAARGPVVVDAHYVWPDGVAAARLAAELSLPFTITARGSDINVAGQDSVVARRIAAVAPRAFGLFAVSRVLGDRFAAIAGVPRSSVGEVRNGVDLERFCPGDGAAARAALGLPASGRLLLGVGRLVAAKGFLVVARALAALPGDVRLVLIGAGPERAAIAAAGGDRVLFLGERPPDDVALACRACDLLVLPSQREGWPNVVTEALASGLGVVATDVGGIPQILDRAEPGVCDLGALVPAGDEAAFGRLLGEALQRRVDGARARALAERYGWDEPVALLCDVFQRALAEAAA